MVNDQGTGSSIGELSITGSVDTTLIDRGFKGIERGFSNIKGFIGSVNSDFTRLGSALGTVGKRLMTIGTVGSAALINLAKSAPAVAPAMAKIDVAMTKLKFAAGEALAPAFEKVADLLDRFAGWTKDNPKIFSGLVGTFTALAGLGGLSAVTKLVTALGSFAVSASGITALTLLAGIAAGAGGFSLGEYLGGKFGDFIQSKINQSDQNDYYNAVENIDAGPQQVVNAINSPEAFFSYANFVAQQEQDRKNWMMKFWSGVFA